MKRERTKTCAHLKKMRAVAPHQKQRDADQQLPSFRHRPFPLPRHHQDPPETAWRLCLDCVCVLRAKQTYTDSIEVREKANRLSLSHARLRVSSPPPLAALWGR